MFALPAVIVIICLTFYSFANGRNVFFSESQLTLLPFVAGLFASALYASVVFCSDQHGQRHRFLAEHAAWPRYVWLARLAVWLLPIIVLLAIVAALGASGIYDLQREWGRQIQRLFGANNGIDFRYMTKRLHDAGFYSRGLLFGPWGVLTGLALGQACSLFFRRALVAGFAAMVIAIPLCVLGLAIWAWELSAATFLLPLAIGLFAATWLRIPDWIVDRNSPCAWLKVAAAALIPLLFISWRLPAERKLPLGKDRIGLAHIADGLGTQFSFHGNSVPVDASAVITKWLARDKSEVTAADRATGDRLVRLAEMIELPSRPVRSSASAEPTPAQQSAYLRDRIEMNRTVLDEAASLSSEHAVFTNLFDDLDPKTRNTTYDRLTSLAEMLSDAGEQATDQDQLDDA